MKNNRGSALVVVLIITAFVIIAATSLISVTQSEFVMSKSSNDSNAAYYIAEAGIERALNIISITKPISAVLNSANNPTSTIIDSLVSQYFDKNNNDNSKNYMYPSLNTYASNDRTRFQTTYTGISCYYDVSFDISTPSDYNSATNDYRKTIYITSVGHYGNSTKTIKSQYTIGGVLASSSQSGGSNYVNYDDLDNFYKENVLNVIDKNSNTKFNCSEFIINGNCLFYTNNLSLNTTVNKPINTENIAIIANTMTRGPGIMDLSSEYLFFDGYNTELSIPSFNTSAQVFVSSMVDASKYTGSNKHNLSDILGDTGKKKDDIYDGSWPLLSDSGYSILTSDCTHFRNFEFRPLPQNIDFTKPVFGDDVPPGQFSKIGIYYYKGPVNNINSNYLNDEYGNPGSYVNGNKNLNQDFDILVSKGDLNINLGNPNNTFTFQGIIYCDGTINIINCNFQINGIIVARGINCSGKFTANYESSNGNKLDYRIGLIDDIFRTYASSNSSFNYEGISCAAWDIH